MSPVFDCKFMILTWGYWLNTTCLLDRINSIAPNQLPGVINFGDSAYVGTQYMFKKNSVIKSTLAQEMVWHPAGTAELWPRHAINQAVTGSTPSIIWTSAALILTGPLETYSSEIAITILQLSLKKMDSKMLSAKWRLIYRHINILMIVTWRSQSWLNTNNSGKLGVTGTGSEIW